MILVDPKDRSGNHYINERALTFSENDLEDPQRIAVSLVSGTVIIVNKKDDGDGVSIPRAANGDYEKWTLKGFSTKIPDERNAAHFIFARLSRSDRTALIVFSLNNYNIDGSISTFTTNEDGTVTESRTDASTEFYFIRIGHLSETDGSSDRVLTYDCGKLSVGYEIDDLRGAWNELFVPHYENPANPKELTWIEAKAHMGIAGGLTSFINNGNLNLPQIYDGLPIDNQTLYWETITNEDGSVTKVLKAKGGSSSGGSASGTVTWDDIEGKPDLSQYALDTDLSKYLPLTGGTLTGNLILNKASLAVWNSEVELYQSPLRMTSAYGGYDRLNISYDESGKKLCIQSGSYDGKTQRGYMSISGIEDAELQRLYINATETIFSGAIRLKKDSESIGGLITYDESGGYFSLDHSLRMGTNSINFHGAYISKDSYVGASLRIQDTDGITLSTGYEKPLIVAATGIELYGGLIEYDPTLDAFILNGNLLVTGSVTSVYTGN